MTAAVHDSGETTAERVWRDVCRASFAAVPNTTPGGEPRSSGVVFGMVDRTMYVVVSSTRWKARHIALTCTVLVTVPVRRGGVLSLMMPIPPATVRFRAAATVRPGRHGGSH